MIHEPVNYFDAWLFLIIAVVMVSILIFVSVKLMNHLDKLEDRKLQKKDNLSKIDKN